MAKLPSRAALAIAAGLALLGPSAVSAWAQEADELPLAGPAYQFASEAYEAFARKDFATAAAKAREAIRQRPDVVRLKRLLLDALEAAGRAEEADREVAGFIAAGETDPDLIRPRPRVTAAPPGKDAGFDAATEAYEAYGARDMARALAKAQEAVRLSPDNPGYRQLLANVSAGAKAAAPAPVNPAYQSADNAYRALARKDVAEAITEARKAVSLAPGNSDYRMLLIGALAAAGQAGEAERIATAALKTFGRDAKLLAQRGYLLQRLGRPAAAADDFAAALRTGKSTGADTRTLRLALADAAQAAKQPERALDALAVFRNERSYEVASRRGFALAALKRNEEAEAAFAMAVDAARTRQERATAMSARIGLLADLDRKVEAKQALSDAARRGDLATVQDLDIAYLAVRVGDDELADERFARAQAVGRLKGTSLVDAAYAAKRLYRNEHAQELLRAAIDAEAAGELALDPQYLFGLRRENAELSRSWGAYASVTYGAVGVSPSAPLALLPSGGNVLQSGAEIYWRPPEIGYRNGAIFELFGRTFTTLSDETGGPTGVSTMQGAVGARWKPFSHYNVVLEASRLFPIGEFGRSDTLLRVAFSEGRGTDLRVDASSWWMWQVYGEVGRYLEKGQTVGSFEGRAGYSFRLSSHFIATPLVAVSAGYDNLLARPWAVGAGPGLNLRYWFRESKYTAPMSYIDLNVQYRFKLGGDDRAQGVFAGITVAY